MSFLQLFGFGAVNLLQPVVGVVKDGIRARFERDGGVRVRVRLLLEAFDGLDDFLFWKEALGDRVVGERPETNALLEVLVLVDHFFLGNLLLALELVRHLLLVHSVDDVDSFNMLELLIPQHLLVHGLFDGFHDF